MASPTQPKDSFVEIKFILHAFLVGCLSSCPLITCLLFASSPAYQKSLFQTLIFSWILLGFQVFMFILSFKWPKTSDLSFISTLDPICHILLLATFLVAEFPSISYIMIPSLTFITTSILSMINIMSYQLIYLCPDIYQRYYELGLLTSGLTYTYLLHLGWAKSSVSLVLLFLVFHAGIHSLNAIATHNIFKKALTKCKNNKNICKSPHKTSTIGGMYHNCMVEIWLTVFFLCITVGTVSTFDYRKGLRPPGELCYLIYIGNFCLTGIMLFRGVKTSVLFIIPMAIIACLLHLNIEMTRAVQNCLLNCIYLFFFNAIGYQFYSIRLKAKHNIICPRFTLMLALITNIAVTVPQLVLRTVQKYIC
ncbi:BMFR2 [Vombatid gammaherpesvirus 1]|uniref:BMFR2 n=1 Tax=Vombatid gammaherpesvirus 1 TaxID=2052651 RepID=A0A3Q8JCC4_9GAMA|nr:BMFR2 [Vombatid gammaherpesvirus 1]AZB49156.1 BMFR2 [Vombatid gammaherpesvirus 1]